MKKTYHGSTFYIEQETRKEYTFEMAHRAPGVRLILPDGKKNILLNKEYRKELNAWDYRLPGGKVFDSLDEYLACDKKLIKNKAKQAGIKEAREEQGIEVEDLDLFDLLHCGATVEWDLYYFVVKKYKKKSIGQSLEADEQIKISSISFTNAMKLCLEGKIHEGRSASILMRYLNLQKKLLS